MGVPVVTLEVERYVERLSATKLSAVGVSELITTSIGAYIEKAVEFAADPAMLRQYHISLRHRMAQSPLCDPVSLARALEDAYRNFWLRFLAGKTKPSR